MKKVLFAVMHALVFCLTAFAASSEIWDGSIAISFGGGTGTENDPYRIYDGAQLAYLAQQVNSVENFSEGKYFKLMNDIKLNDTTDWGNWDTTAPKNTWAAIGSSSGPSYYSFDGTFDGQGYEISGIYINSSSDYQGLFGRVGDDGTVKNLGVVDSYIKANDFVGGVVGGGSADNCYNSGKIIGNRCTGGVVGIGETSYSYNTGDVTGWAGVGGVTGTNFQGVVSNCYNTGNVTGTVSVGGVAGDNRIGTTSNCYNTGTVSGSGYVGGVVGYNDDFGTITNTYYLSGCAKDGNGTVQNGCGTLLEGSTTADVSGQTTGLVSEQMKQQSSFAGFDFENVWAIDPDKNGGYPYLRETSVITPKLVSVFVNGKRVNFDVAPTIIDGRTLVPLRAIFEKLGATVEWDDSTKTVTGTKDGTTIKMTVGQNSFTVNGETKTLDVPSQIIDGRTLVPVRAISESFGVDVEWHAEIKTVCVKEKSFTAETVTMTDKNGAEQQVESFLVDLFSRVGYEK